MHTDTTSIQLRQGLRATLAAQMAEYERRHGPVITLPIINRAKAPTSYNGRDVTAENARARAKGAARQRKPKAPVLSATAQAALDAASQLPLKPRRTAKAKAAATLREAWP